MKMISRILMVIVFVVCFFIAGCKSFGENNDLFVSEQITEVTTSVITIENESETEENNVYQKKNDFYLYKMRNDGEDATVFREDGQYISIRNEIMFFYDENGLVTSVLDGENGRMEVEYFYDDEKYSGNAVSDKNNNIIWVFEYDINYKVLSFCFVENDEVDFAMVYEYDSNGNIVQLKEISGSKKTITKYDADGDILESCKYLNDELIQKSDYDSEGRLSEIHKWNNGQLYSYSEVKKCSDKYIEYIYVNEGIETGKYMNYNEREYDKYGNLISVVYYESNGKVLGKTIYEYKLKN